MVDVIDFKIVTREQEEGGEFFDIEFTDDGDFLVDDTFETPLLMSIFSERRAKNYEINIPRYRRGWIGNLLYSDGFEDGSGAWLYEQRRLNQSTLNGVRDEVEKGTMWFIDDNYADQVNVSTEPSGKDIIVSVVIKSNKEEVLNTKITV